MYIIIDDAEAEFGLSRMLVDSPPECTQQHRIGHARVARFKRRGKSVDSREGQVKGLVLSKGWHRKSIKHDEELMLHW